MDFPEIKKLPEFEELQTEVLEAIDKGKAARPVKTDADMTTAAEILASAEFASRRAETVRLNLGAPYRKHADEISTEVKELASPLTGIIERLTKEIGDHRQKQQEAIDKERAKQEKLAAKRQERENKRAAKAGRKPITHSAPEIEDASKTIETSDGSKITQKGVRKYRVIDFSKLPERFKQENKGELNRAAKAGEPAPDGAEFYIDHTNQFDFG